MVGAMRLRADLVLLLVAVLWGSAFAAQRIAGQLGSVFMFNGARFLLAALMLLPFIKQRRAGPRQWLWMIAAGLILFMASALQQAGLITTNAGNAGFITSTYVVLVPFVLWIGWAQPPTWRASLAVILAAAGAFLLSTSGHFVVYSGDLLEAVSAVFWSLHVVIIGKYAARFDPVAFSCGQLFVGGLLNLLGGSFFEGTAMPLVWPLISAIFYTAVFSLGLGYTLQVWAQRQTPPTDAAIILSLESVFAGLAGWVLLREGVTLVQGFGCILILGGVFISQLTRWSRIEKSTASTD